MRCSGIHGRVPAAAARSLLLILVLAGSVSAQFAGYDRDYSPPEGYPSWVKVRPLNSSEIAALVPNQTINPSTPNWASIITDAPPGSVIALENGTYLPSTQINLPVNGTEGNPVTIIALHNKGAVIDSTNAREAFNPYGRGDHLAPYTRMVGLRIVNGERSGIYIRWGAVEHFTVQDCEISDTGYSGIHVAGGEGLIVSGCYIHDNEDGIRLAVKDASYITKVIIENTTLVNNDVGSSNSDGVGVENELSTDITIRDCVSYNHVDAGYDMKPEITVTRSISHDNENGFKAWRKLYLYNSLAYDNDRGVQTAGLNTGSDPPTVKILGTTITGNNVGIQSSVDGTYGSPYSLYQLRNSIIDGSFTLDSANQTDIDYNVYTDAGELTGANSVLANATDVFADLAGDDFHLKTGSPAVDVGGNYSTLPRMEYDLDFMPRSEPYDAGAYDFVKGAAVCDGDGDGQDRLSCGGTDCDDYDPDIYLGATEVCDLKDNDCDGEVDEGFDQDNDSWTSCNGDCNDSLAGVNPGVYENPYNASLCENGLDDDCSGGDIACYHCYDSDSDGFEGYSATECPRGVDCDDNDSGISPAASETEGNGVDDDCDGRVDEDYNEDMIAYYRFEEAGPTVTDSSGNGNHGTAYGSPTHTTGYLGSAFDFDGVDDYVDLTDDPDFERSEMTIALWFMKQSTDWSILFSDGRVESNYAAQTNSYALSTSGTSLRFRWDNGGTRYEDALALTVNDDEWYHVAVSWSSGNISMYLNGGEQNASYGVSPGGGSNSRRTFIGAHEYFYDGSPHVEENFTGLIDEIRVYNWSMSAYDVARLYTAESLCNASLLAHYRLDGDAGDSSGNGNNGTVVGVSYTPSGRFDGAYVFNGSTDYITAGGVLDFADYDAFSVSMYLKRNRTNSTEIPLAKRQAASPWRGYMLRFDNDSRADRLCLHLTNNASAADELVVCSDPLNDTSGYYHIAATYDGSGTAAGAKIYVNGEENTTLTVTDSLTGTLSNSAPFNIGSSDNGSSPFMGAVDEVAVWDRALSPGDVQEIYVSGVICGITLTVTGVSPADGSTVYVNSTLVCASYLDSDGVNSSSVLLWLDAVDVTGSATVDEHQACYNATDLADGLHNASFWAADDLGNGLAGNYTWSFTVLTGIQQPQYSLQTGWNLIGIPLTPY